MANHRKRRTRYNRKYVGKHRAVVPKSYTGQRMALVLPLTFSLVLYPTIAGDGSGLFPSVGIIIPFLDDGEANAGEVITETTDPIDEVIDDVEEPVEDTVDE